MCQFTCLNTASPQRGIIIENNQAHEGASPQWGYYEIHFSVGISLLTFGHDGHASWLQNNNFEMIKKLNIYIYIIKFITTIRG